MVIEQLYSDTCTIETVKKIEDDKGRTIRRPQVTYHDVPCRISFSGTQTAAGDPAEAEQYVKVFCAPNLKIPKGSTVSIVRGDRTLHYKASSEPAVYPTHQEINLEIAEAKA